MASAEFDEKSSEKRPAVQVGDPFMEKLLLEACLELMQTDALIGVQDMGAAGLTCSTSEMGARGGTGIEIDVSHVPQRETGMTPYEIMLSESQERMLLVVKKGREAEVERSSRSGTCTPSHIGDVTDDGLLRVKNHGAGRRRDPERPRSSTKRRSTTGPIGAPGVPRRGHGASTGERCRAADRRGMRVPRICSRRRPSPASAGSTASTTTWSAPTRIVLAGMGAGVVRIKGTTRALAMSTDGNGRYCYLNPRRGAMLAVAEAARNVACAGGVPIGAHQLPELRQPRAARDHVAARRGDRGHGRGVPGARHPDHRRQRQPLQRDRRPGDLSDARSSASSG